MLQFKKEYLLNEENMSTIVEKVEKILDKRKKLYKRYTRKIDNKDLKVPLEYYITTIASGFFGGKAPLYTVKQEKNKNKINIIKKLFNKIIGANDNVEEFQTMIDYIRDYNDDSSFYYDIVKDYLITGACYGLQYETGDDKGNNELVYAHTSSLQTVAVYDFSTPVQKIGLIRIWQELDADGFEANMIEIITDEEKRYYKNGKKQPEAYKEIPEMREDVKWLLVPALAVENPDELGIFEPVISLIDAFENIIKNNKNIFEYNDNAKLQITGFTPQNPLMIEQLDEEGNIILDKNGNPVMIKNPARVKEDEIILQAKTFYTPDGNGKIEWIIKQLNDTASENHKKTLIELILMIACIPNFSDVGFTKADNSSALEKKFFPLEQLLIQADKLFKKELLCMWENIVDRINFKKKTKFDFREIFIELKRNIPFDNKELVDIALSLREILSDETVMGMLPYDLDVESELAKLEEQRNSNYENNMTKVLANKNTDPTKDVGVEDVGTTG